VDVAPLDGAVRRSARDVLRGLRAARASPAPASRGTAGRPAAQRFFTPKTPTGPSPTTTPG
jgi:hypothetical protein